jgi:hypothetical protein
MIDGKRWVGGDQMHNIYEKKGRAERVSGDEEGKVYNGVAQGISLRNQARGGVE